MVVASLVALGGVASQASAHSTSEPVAVALDAREDVAIKALKLWLKAYRKGELDLVDLDRFKGVPRNKKNYVSVKLGILPESRLKNLNHEKELGILCEKVAALGTAEAAEALLKVAAIGLGRKKWERELLPGLVRGIGSTALATMKSDAAMQVLRGSAAALSGAESRAALLALGGFAASEDLGLFEKGLQDRSQWIRLSAARALARAKLVSALEAIADRVVQEPTDLVVGACLEAAAATVSALKDPAGKDRELRRMTTSAHDVLGKHTWQVDLAALGYLKQVRSADSVPAMIGVLERAAAKDRKADKLDKTSGVVRQDAYELLRALSGATIPIDTPHLWKDWWDRVHDTFTVAEAKDASAASGETVTTFFGIPIRGSHVLFIVDLSGSMQFPSIEPASSTGGSAPSKMSVAR